MRPLVKAANARGDIDKNSPDLSSCTFYSASRMAKPCYLFTGRRNTSLNMGEFFFFFFFLYMDVALRNLVVSTYCRTIYENFGVLEEQKFAVEKKKKK